MALVRQFRSLFASFEANLQQGLQQLIMPGVAMAGPSPFAANRVPSWQADWDQSSGAEERPLDAAVWQMNRNKRSLKAANHGARPCNSNGRKSRRMSTKHRTKSKLLVPRAGHVPLEHVQTPPNW